MTRRAEIQQTRSRIRALVSIAAGHGTSVSTQELLALLPAGSFGTAEALERFVAEDEALRRELRVRQGEVVPHEDAVLLERRAAQRRLTADRLRLASSFGARVSRICPGVDLVAVSGSTAFGGCEPEDDIDFFLVTRRRRMWAVLLASMALARLDRKRDAGLPIFCFNRVTEREPCLVAFGRPGDALFAREALSLRVVRGGGFFQDLLKRGQWMEGPFPTLYRRNLAADVDPQASPVPDGGAVWSVANGLAFLGLAPYLYLAGLVRNARLRRQGRMDALFRTVVAFRFFSYDSRKFETLRERYAREL